MKKSYFLDQKLQFIDKKDPDLQAMRFLFFSYFVSNFAFLHLGPDCHQSQWNPAPVRIRNPARDYVMCICSEQMKYQLPEQVEQKYLPPDQQRLTEHERYFQVSLIKNPRFCIFSSFF